MTVKVCESPGAMVPEVKPVTVKTVWSLQVRLEMTSGALPELWMVKTWVRVALPATATVPRSVPSLV